MARRPSCSKLGDLKKGAWTAHEDLILTNYIHTHGETGWRSLPPKAGLNRSGKSCRLRWLNYLRPEIKRGNITPDEEELIVRMHRLLGNRWALIAGRLPGRTDNEIKNYWNTHLSKKIAMSSSNALNSTSRMPIRKSISFQGMKEHSPRSPNSSKDNGDQPCDFRCASDKQEGRAVSIGHEEQMGSVLASCSQFLQDTQMAGVADDSLIQLLNGFISEPCYLQIQPENSSEVLQEDISLSEMNVSYPPEYCNSFSLPCIDFGPIVEYLSVDGLLQPTALDLEDICPVESCNVDNANCLAIAREQGMTEIRNSALQQPDWMIQQHQPCVHKSSHLDLDEFGQRFDKEENWEEEYRNIPVHSSQ